MKILHKITITFALTALAANLTLTACLLDRPRTTEETGVYFTPAERYGNLDDVGTLFVVPDGNLFAVDAQYATSAEEFLLKMDSKGTAEKTDDEVLAVWQAPLID